MATVAPPRTRAADLDIPPPPLPEFYLPKGSIRRDDDEQEVDTTTVMKIRRYTVEAEDDKAVGRSLKSPSAATKATDEIMTRVRYAEDVQYRPVVTMPPPAGGAADVPPLAIYHICRLCLRPRSARYHREHPIPVNGLPPPPGICRRCRVMSVEEVSKVAETIKCGESNEIRIGLGCIAQDDGYVSNQEYKDLHNGQNFMPRVEHLGLRQDSSSGRSVETREEHKKISYRHIRVRESSMSSSPPRPKTHAESTAQDVIDAVSVKSAAKVQSEKSQGETAHSGFREVGEGHITARRREADLPTTTQVATYAACASSRIPVPDSPLKTIAHASAAASVQQPAQPQWSEPGIRRLARDEVERYRQAERKLEAHRDPYAHGRMVPLQRRIEPRAAEAVVLPWEEKEMKVEKIEEVVMVKKQSSQRQPQAPASQRAPPEPRPNYRREEAEGSDVTEKVPTWMNEEILLERVRQPPTYTAAGGDQSVFRQCAGIEKTEYRSTVSKLRPVREKKGRAPEEADSQGCRSSRQRHIESTDSAEPRSERSERRKWDIMSDLKVQAQPEARREQASGRRRASRDSYVRREIWLPPGKDHEIIEIIDHYDDESVPLDREVKDDRKLAAQTDVLRDVSAPACERSSSKQIKAARDLSKPVDEKEPSESQPSKRGNSVRSTGRTEEELDIKWRKCEARDRGTRCGPASLSSLGMKGRSTRLADDDSEKSLQDGEPSKNPRPRAFDLRWAAANANAMPRRGRDEVEDDEKTIHPNAWRSDGSQAKGEHPSAQKPTEPPESVATLSRKRDGPPQSEHEYIYTERIVEPVSIHPQHAARNDARRHYTRTEEIWRKSNGSRANGRSVGQGQSNAPTSSTAKPKRPEAKAAEGSEHSSKVRFATKVDISPTPPGSDTSSGKFRLIGGSARSKAKLRDGESGEDLVAEFERRGRSKTRESRSPHSGAGEQEYLYERRETVRETPRVDGGLDDAPPPAAWEGASSKSQRKPLVDAYSESPTRERSTRWEDESSGAGPNRPEPPRQESMGGSDRTTRAEVDGGTEDARYGHAHGRWSEDLTVPASMCGRGAGEFE